ncbi:hypothetical protein ABIB25_002230 [Nakamurella sp. UYEF19]
MGWVIVAVADGWEADVGSLVAVGSGACGSDGSMMGGSGTVGFGVGNTLDRHSVHQASQGGRTSVFSARVVLSQLAPSIGPSE